MDRTDILDWMEEAFPVIRHSAWSPALDVFGIDVLDSLRAPILMALLRLSREPPQADRNSERPPRTAVRRLLSSLHCHLNTQRAALLSLRPAPVEVVFWPLEPTHLRQHVPTAAALGQENASSAFFACRPTIVRQLRDLGIAPVSGLRSWPGSLAEAELAAERRSSYLSAAPGVGLPPMTAFHPDQVCQELRSVIKLLLPAVARSVVNVDSLIKIVNPKVLVIGNDLGVQGRVGCLRARQLNLSTACLMHGGISGETIQRYHIADVVLVYGNQSRGELLLRGLTPDRVIACGAPYLDNRPHQTGCIDPRVRSRLGLNRSRPWVLLGLSGPGDSVSHAHHLAMIAVVMRLSSRFPDIDFVAKLHRKDLPEYFETVRQQIPGARLRVVPYGTKDLPSDIFEWLQGCALVITCASTVAVEAMLMNVPVVTMDLAGEIRDVDFIEAGATLHVRSEAELEETLSNLHRNPNILASRRARVDRFLSEQFFAVDGRSAQRCARIIARSRMNYTGAITPIQLSENNPPAQGEGHAAYLTSQ